MSPGDWIALASFLGTVVVILLATKFVTKKEYEANQQERQKWRDDMEKRVAIIEREAALIKQPLEAVENTLKSIDGKMERFLDAHQDMDSRLNRLEAQRDADDRAKERHRHRHGSDAS